MTTINITKQIVETIKENSQDDEPLQEFITAILNWELSTKGSYQFKETYRQMIKQFCSKWGQDDEN